MNQATRRALEELEYLYTHQKLSSYEIAEKTGTSRITIQRRLRELGISRNLSEAGTIAAQKRKQVNQIAWEPILESIKHLYLSEKLSTYEIARITGMPVSTVQQKLKRVIVMRTTSEAKMARLGMGGEVFFTCRICHRRKPISELLRDGRYFPTVYCCNKCA